MGSHMFFYNYITSGMNSDDFYNSLKEMSCIVPENC